jgi:hypothetical protein
MPPSYPNWEWDTSLSIRFIAPNKPIVYKILKDSEEEEFLRKKVAGMILYDRVKKLANALSRHRIQINSATRNELEVVMFLLPPPCTAPKPVLRVTGAQNFRKRLPSFIPSLEPIPEILEENLVNYLESLENYTSGWITLYNHMPKRKRYAIYAAL